MQMMSLEEIKTYAVNYKVVPISCSMCADVRTPVEVLRILKHASSRCYILESMEDAKRWGRYTFLGYNPQMELTCKDGTIYVKSAAGTTIYTESPDNCIRKY